MFGYESPIKQIIGEMQTEFDGEVMRIVQNYGIHVNKEELIDALAYDRGQYEKGYEDGFNADKWIPCSERLPNDKHSVLITTKNGERWTAFYNEVYNEWLDDIDERPLSVIAWQPLPAPYKSEV